MKGFTWHLHHSTLLEWCWNYEGRLHYIETYKPAHEIPTRNRLFQMVKGVLPEAVTQAWTTSNQAWADYEQASGYPRLQAGAYYDRVWEAYQQALADNMPAILALHAQECPDCPWDGYTIFPKAE